MQVIIMAAGEGSRMRPLTDTTHKSLLPINSHETFLSRLLHQLNEYEISKVILVVGHNSEQVAEVAQDVQLNIDIVHNEKYKEDTNIYSMNLALEKLNQEEPTIVIEADIYIDDLALRDIISESKKGNSIWFTKNRFTKEQYGGVLHKNKHNDITDIQIVSSYEKYFHDYYKLLGIMTIGINELNLFKKLVKKYCEQTLKQYYLIPWIENLSNLPSKAYDLGKYIVESVNKPEEYHEFKIFLENQYDNIKEVQLVDVKSLLDIEEHIISRKDDLKNKILHEKVWNKPIIVEKNNKLVLDGHHRFNLAKEIGLSQIPAILVDYDDIEVWSLKDSEEVTKELVMSRVKKNNIYPNKTVKHKFNFKIPECRYDLEELSK